MDLLPVVGTIGITFLIGYFCAIFCAAIVLTTYLSWQKQRRPIQLLSVLGLGVPAGFVIRLLPTVQSSLLENIPLGVGLTLGGMMALRVFEKKLRSGA